MRKTGRKRNKFLDTSITIQTNKRLMRDIKKISNKPHQALINELLEKYREENK